MAMINNKHLTFSLILVCLISVSPTAKAQAAGLNILTISGVVSCTLNATVTTGTSAPPFPNATVQLQCGPLNATVATTTTNLNGVFTFFSNQIPVSLPTLVSSCRAVVTTPLARCNVNLPSVNLTSTLNVVGSLTTGIINFFLVVPTLFTAILPIIN